MVERFGVGMLTIAPLTSNTTNLYDFQALFPAVDTGLEEDSKVQVEQIRAVSVARLGGRLGRVPPELMTQLDAALRLHLSL